MTTAMQKSRRHRRDLQATNPLRTQSKLQDNKQTQIRIPLSNNNSEIREKVDGGHLTR